uniref:DNA-directed RNA polymerase subunit beta n=1 Tax=Nephromyces sp. ex Molgula occidentalis TaxID=2544991 RepID=A0A5C1H7S8_9APIC|nr:plastid-encoded DNA-directed RNA polymerase beta [Nephromyces sp. ex Molgula occidentalis]
MLYSIVPFSLKNTEILSINYINFLKYKLIKKINILIPKKLFFKNYFKLIFNFKNLQINTTKYENKILEHNLLKINPFLQIKIPIIIYSFYKNKYNFFNLNLINFPKLDFQENFILNGLQRTLLSKIKRNEGIYFYNKLKFNNLIYIACIKLNNYNKLFIEINQDNLIMLYDNTFKIKINFILFLHFIGITNNTLIKFSKYGNSIIFRQLLKKSFKSYYTLSYNLFKYFKFFIKISLTFFNLNFEFKIFNKISLNYINNFNLTTSIIKNKLFNLFGFDFRNQIIYLPKDLIGIMDTLLDLKYKKKSINNLDHFGYKKIESFNTILFDKLEFILEQKINKFKHILTKFFNSNLTNKFLIKLLNNNKTFINFQEYLNINPFVQYLDQLNSLSEIIHKLKLSKETFSKKNLNFRDIKFSELSKLCLIDTSEGLNSGLIVSLPNNIIKTKLNTLITPFKFKNKENEKFSIKFMDSLYQDKTQISLDKLFIRKNLNFNKFTILIFENSFFKTINTKIKFNIILNEKDLFSPSENLIPFMFHNDPARWLIGSKMQSQSVPLIYKQKSFIFTGYEQLISRKNINIINCFQEGIIIYVSSYKIIIRDLFNREIIYYLKNYNFSNQGIIINYTPIIWIGERVTSGQLIAVNQDFIENEFCIGNNVFIMYGSYLGYEFEDSLIINKNLIENNIFSSLHMDIYETMILFDKLNPEFIYSNIPKYNKYSKRNLDSFGIIKKGSKILENDLILAKIGFNIINFKKESLKNFLFILFGTKLKNIIDKSIIITSGNSGRVIKIEIFIDKKLIYQNILLKIRIFIIKQRLLEIGDKIWGRYGNKGVISYISNSVDLPYTKDYIKPDIITGSLGVPSRMNLGQLFETLFGISCFYLDKRLLIDKNINEKCNFNLLKSLCYNNLKQINLNIGTSTIFNPYIPGKISLIDGRWGYKIKGSVLFGCSLYTKLIHMVKNKIHYRTIGPYSEITQQPVKGRSKKGGQRFGEMEVWALEAFGSAYNLRELLNIKSDDIKSRLNMQENLLYNKNLILTTISESFRLVLNEIKGLALNIESFLINPFSR